MKKLISIFCMYKNKPRLVSTILVLLPFGAENHASKGSGMSSKGKNRWQWEEKYDECWIKKEKKPTQFFVFFLYSHWRFFGIILKKQCFQQTETGSCQHSLCNCSIVVGNWTTVQEIEQLRAFLTPKWKQSFLKGH